MGSRLLKTEMKDGAVSIQEVYRIAEKFNGDPALRL